MTVFTALPDQELDTATAPRPDKGWSGTIVPVANARLAPPLGKLPLSFPASVYDNHNRIVAEAQVWRNNRLITTPTPAPAGTVDHIKGTWLWGGLLYGHFGHFLCESATRLWALDQLGDQIEGILFFAKFSDEDQGVAQYHQDFVNLMGRDLPIRIVRVPTSVEQLLVPGQGFGLGAMSKGTPQFRAAMRRRFAKDITPDGAKKLYISRSAIGPRRGGVLFERVLEQHLMAQDYDIFHPQKHSLRDQIKRYKAAKLIVAAEGSALHLLAMVGRAGQNVGIVPRRVSGATRNIINHLEAFTGTRPHLLEALNRTWMPKESARKHLSVAELDFPRLQTLMATTGFIGNGPAWPSVSEADALAEIRSERFRRLRDYQPTRCTRD